VQIGGEGPLDDRDVDTFQINNYAQQYGALVLALEHRMYGESQPFSSLTTENLQYLSSQQA
jgi:serine protease 16